MNKLSYLLSFLVSMMIILGSCQKEELTINDQDAYHKKGKKPKVAIYHVTGNGSYHLIYVNENAVPAHLAHGDILRDVTIKDGDLATGWINIAENPEKWYIYDETPGVPFPNQINPDLATFVDGPATPPLGAGSIEISVTGQQRYNLGTSQYRNTNLADITTFAYSTYNVTSTYPDGSGYIQFSVSFDGTNDYQSRLTFVPSVNGSVVQDSWQEWDALAGGTALWNWQGYAGNTPPNTWPDGNTDMYRTWDDLIAAFPYIKMNNGLHSFMAVRVGNPYLNGYTENIDAFKFGANSIERIFDFE